jgi:hypothetical protein
VSLDAGLLSAGILAQVLSTGAIALDGGDLEASERR